MPLTTLLVLGLVVGVGAFVQRIAGFGLAVVAAPFVVMAAPHVMPAALLFVVLPLPVLEMARAHRDIRWRPFGWAMAGRLATMPLGVWLAANASHTVTSLLVAGMVLVAVAGSLTRWRVRPSSGIALGAGALTGISATTASIGGPFFGLALPELDDRLVGIKRVSRRAMSAPCSGSSKVAVRTVKPPSRNPPATTVWMPSG